MFNSFILKRVPEMWEKYAYPSLKPLGSWIEDFQERIKFFKEWMEKDSMQSYWISSMFFPQGFMTAAMQQFSRRTHIAIDTLTFKTEVKDFFKDKVTKVPENGVNIHGLYLEGCRWDADKGMLNESRPFTLFEEVPCILLDPVQLSEHKKVGY